MTPEPGRGAFRRLFRVPGAARRIERDVDDELRFHFESRIADLVEQGTTIEDARRIAALEYGDVDASRAELANVDRRVAARRRRADLLDVARQDIADALRGMRRQPGFAATIVVTLALAVSANAATFSLMLLSVAVLASLVPALRASHIDPAVVLRDE